MSAAPAIVLFGGRSEIGLAIVERLVAEHRAPVVLAQRPDPARVDEDASVRARLVAAGATSVDVVDFDAVRLETHQAVVDDVFAGRVVGTAVVAFGVLGDQHTAWTQTAAAQHMFTVNTTAAAGVGVALGQAFTRQARGGTIVAVSSVAGVRVRRANFVYGASKSATDDVYLHLGTALAPSGVRILVVRPGAVRTRMIDGNRPVALTVETAQVARAVTRSLAQKNFRSGSRVVHVPRLFGPVLGLAQMVPLNLWLSLGR